jgi:N-acetyl-anhydromuramyl-L-alanine amidase AmpD
MSTGDGLSRRGFMLGAAGLAAGGAAPAAGLPVGSRSGPMAEPAAAQLPNAPDFNFLRAGTGRFTRADRPWDGIDIKYIVIHDTEASYGDTLSYFHGASDGGVGAATHYVIRSWDGRVTQMVPTNHIAFHTGNFWYNMHSIGIEHEGYLAHGHRWYTDAQYQSSAKLVRYLADRFNIPLDREHIIGHEEIPAEKPEGSAKQHYDPGPFWDWAYYFRLLDAPLYKERDSAPDGPDVVALMPRFADNYHTLTDCNNGCVDLPSQASNVVYLHTQPSDDSSLLSDPALHTWGLPGTSQTWDWSARAVVGQRFVVADRRDDWTAIWFGGHRGWFHDPDRRIGVPAVGEVITPRDDRDSIPVYGTAYPERSAFPKHIEPDDIVPLQYRIPAGQRYVAVAQYRSDDYQGSAAHPDDRVYLAGDRRLVEISYNHRRAFVDMDDIHYLT